jgi:RNA polymerase sigma factor (sigma-70 family)
MDCGVRDCLGNRENTIEGIGIIMVEVNQLISELKRVATRLSTDGETQRDLVQEMYVHFMTQTSQDPDKHVSWYVKGCEFHARNYLRRGRSVDSPKRSRGKVLLRIDQEEQGFANPTEAMESESMTTDGTLYSHDVIEQIKPMLSDRQQEILTRLVQGQGVRQIGRDLGISHVAVIKHRRKIAKVAGTVMQLSDSEYSGFAGHDDHRLSGACAASGWH